MEGWIVDGRAGGACAAKGNPTIAFSRKLNLSIIPSVGMVELENGPLSFYPPPGFQNSKPRGIMSSLKMDVSAAKVRHIC